MEHRAENDMKSRVIIQGWFEVLGSRGLRDRVKGSGFRL